ncbi:MAG: hypothetical protein NAG76_18140 [Candidatus Pristimantibacillus lignocellulolyticus]|uniref:Uncharacterized protein n=1 Tax=Candidatus Pristimantibacillus lignocellulolyticus TaxID=2994561 RepID=A0A9J6ZCT3_9BACL|nr:MAG: hypothetical protein NAG76_18140 [Candidatus Pristimantibacillus lignocellulolyticus]
MKVLIAIMYLLCFGLGSSLFLNTLWIRIGIICIALIIDLILSEKFNKKFGSGMALFFIGGILGYIVKYFIL